MTPDPVITRRGKRRAPLRPGEGRVWAAAALLLLIAFLLSTGA